MFEKSSLFPFHKIINNNYIPFYKIHTKVKSLGLNRHDTDAQKLI